MSNVWHYVLTSKLNNFWFGLSCLVLLSVSLAMKAHADSMVRVFDETIDQLSQPTPSQLLPAALRPATGTAHAIL